MGQSQWWDREYDAMGRAIRPDVRTAAVNVWTDVCAMVERIRGNCAEAQELLEKAVADVSAYLNKKNTASQTEGDPGGLLFVAVYRLAWRLARRDGRFQEIGNIGKLEETLFSVDWVDQADGRMFLDKLVCMLPAETRTLLRLRMEGLEWDEIGDMIGVKGSVARKRFWRDVRIACRTLIPTVTPRAQRTAE